MKKYFYLSLCLIILVGCYNKPEEVNYDTFLINKKDNEDLQFYEKDGWIDFETEEIDGIRISKTEDFTFKELRFKAIWDDKLTYI
jgi:hypothetical protein